MLATLPGRDAKVVQLEKFGVIVEFLPGKEGLVHLSELDMARPADTGAWAIGDSIDVALVEARRPPAAARLRRG